MRLILSSLFILLICSFVYGQNINAEWYSETLSNGVRIQNSYPKGGPYKGPTKDHYNYSYLVFFSRVTNESEDPLELNLSFSSDSISIPNSPGTFMKLFLPPDTMSLDKRSSFSYGFTELKSLDQSTSFHTKLNPDEDCLFYVVAIFFQTNADSWNQERGGNRAELILNGQDLFYKIPPQIELLTCGNIILSK